MNKLYYENIITNIKSTLNGSNSVASLEHDLTKGNIREYFISKLLKPYLNPKLSICTGIIIDSQNNQSNQIDIIIYDPNVIPPILNEIIGFIPYESVVATIEVKSKMNKGDMISSIKNAISVKKLKANWKAQIYPTIGYINSPLCCVFSFDTDLTEKNDYIRFLETYDELKNKNEHENIKVPISCLCVANKLTFKCLNATVDPPLFTMTFNNNNYEEIIDFIIFIIDGCNIFKNQKGEMFLNDYIR